MINSNALSKAKNNLTNPFSAELPYSLDAEKSVLSSLILNFSSVDEVVNLLTTESFYYKPHQIIFQAILDLYKSSQAFDFLVVHDYLKDKGLLDQVGGVPYLLDLQENFYSVGFLEQHAKIIQEKYVFRSLILSCAQVMNACYKPDGKRIEEILDLAEKEIFKLSNSNNQKDFVQLSKLLKLTFKKISEMSENRGSVTGIPTGYSKFDEMTSGLHGGDLIILAARPGMGKTAFALNLALNAWKNGHEVGIFSLEMPYEQLVLRMISTESGIPHHRIRTGNIGSEEWLELTNVATALDEAKIFIDDSPSISILEVKNRARKLKLKHNLKFLVIDYLQLIVHDQKTENRTQEISLISRSLKSLAKELDIPIVALSQLSRSLESRGDKRPLLSDLRESGSIEQDADIVTFIYRDAVYHPETENPNLAEIIISKHRNGPTGSCNVYFDGALTKFVDIVEEH